MKRTIWSHRAAAIAAVAVPAALALQACAPRKIMISNQFVPKSNKVARSMIVPFEKDKKTLAHYYVEVCDFDGTAAKNCNSTLVLENITNFRFTK